MKHNYIKCKWFYISTGAKGEHTFLWMERYVAKEMKTWERWFWFIFLLLLKLNFFGLEGPNCSDLYSPVTL